jgi:putative peptidoglycan binding protein
MKIALLIVCACGTLGFGSAKAQELEQLWFRPSDTLAQRDEYGMLHSSKVIYPPDLEHRYHWRPLYYLEGEKDVARMPAYVGALQVALKRLGYYCGPIDGVFSDDTSAAVAVMQKNYSMRVTGTITQAVRRELHLP